MHDTEFRAMSFGTEHSNLCVLAQFHSANVYIRIILWYMHCMCCWNPAVVNVWVFLRWSSSVSCDFLKGSCYNCSSFGRSNVLCIGWRGREIETNYIAVRNFIEWHRKTACKRWLGAIWMYCWAPHRVSLFFFAASLYKTNTRQVLCVADSGLACLFVCAITTFRCTLYFARVHCCNVYACKKKWVAFGRSVVWLVGWLTGWLVAVSIHTYICACICVWVYVRYRTLLQINKHSSSQISKNYDMRLVDCELLCRNHTNCMSVCSSRCSPQVKISEEFWREKIHRPNVCHNVYVIV